MKMKTTRICARKGCNQEFKMFRSTDKYCSGECTYIEQKAKPRKKQKAIPVYTEKRKRESILYTKKRKVFLAKPDNKYCKVASHIFNEVHLTTEIDHKAGRRGKFLNYVPLWIAVSSKAHTWIHAHPKKAYELGFLIRSTTVNI